MGYKTRVLSKNFSAKTYQNNTHESDLMEEVLHVVEFEQDGEKRALTLQAKCPMDAIEKVRRLVEMRDFSNNGGNKVR